MYDIVNETMKLCGQQYTETSTPLSISLKHSSLLTTSVTDKSTGAVKTSVSSVDSDLFNKLDPHLYDE